jgi:hypothetical protein
MAKLNAEYGFETLDYNQSHVHTVIDLSICSKDTRELQRDGDRVWSSLYTFNGSSVRTSSRSLVENAKILNTTRGAPIA